MNFNQTFKKTNNHDFRYFYALGYKTENKPRTTSKVLR